MAGGQAAGAAPAARLRPHHHHPVLVTLALVLLFGVVLVGATRPTRDPPRDAAPPAAVPAPAPASTTTSTTAPAPSPATVLLVGDSLLQQAADGIRAALPGTTVIDGTAPGTGLLNGPLDWSARADELLARYHPDVVVVSFVGNYDERAGTLVADSPAYYAAWDAASQRLTDRIRAAGAAVDWVEQPPLHSPNFYGIAATRTRTLFGQSLELATEPGVRVVRAVDAVSTADGSFTMTHDVCGATATIRVADGVHFTSLGGIWWGALLGRAVAALEGFPARDACTVLAELDPTQA